MMLTLVDIQSNFIATINNGPDALNRSLFAGPVDRVLLGLKAHANTITHARLVALEETFPLTRQHLGDAMFNRLCRDFVETAAARANDNNQIGAGFPRFLTEYSAEQSAIELAQIEWGWLESYHAAESDSLTLSEIATLEDAALLELAVAAHPSLRLIEIRAPLSSQLPAELSQPTQPYIGTIRPDNEVRLLPLDGVTAKIAGAAKNRTTIGNLLTLAAEHLGESSAFEPLLTLIGAGALVAKE
jgi:hypothetical protein